MDEFKREFFRIYDRKMASGQLTFSHLGISKEDFTRMCIDEEFCFSEEQVAGLCKSMKLTEEEAARLQGCLRKC